MSQIDFEKLLVLDGPKTNRKDTHFRRAVSGKGRLANTLRFLVTGNLYASVQYLFRIKAFQLFYEKSAMNLLTL